MTDTATKPKAKPAKLGAEKLTPEEQRRRFVELAKQAGCDKTSPEQFDRALELLGKQRVKPGA